jgi:hypothetical protein
MAALPLLAIAAILIAVPLNWPQYRGISYLAVLALFAGELSLIGWLISSRPAGVFIDSRNRISLSKLQAGGWTIVVLSAFGTAAAFNAATDLYQGSQVDALAIRIPGDLLLAMGISATSLVATPALLSLKSDETPKPSEVADAKARMAAPIGTNGNLVTKRNVRDASWADIFTGEEVGNAGIADIGKIQQVLVTLLLLGIYTAYVFGQLSGSAEKIASLPQIDQSFIWLLAVSHASYLAYKAAPHTKSAP